MEDQIIVDTVMTRFHYRLKDEQLRSISHILMGRDVIVNLPVGFGKSLIYHVLPCLLNSLKKAEIVVVIAPLSAIMQDQEDQLESLGVRTVRLSQECRIVGDNIIDSVDQVVKDVLDSQIIFAHPEALLVAENGHAVLSALQCHVGAIIVDECHKVEDWGKEFRKSFGELGKLRSFFKDVPVACLSATLTKQQIQDLPKHLLMSPGYNVISINPDKKNMVLRRVKKVQGDAYAQMESIYKKQIDTLFKDVNNFPVTLMFMPMQYIANAMQYAYSVFGGDQVTLNNAVFGCLYSKQDKLVTDCILTDLQTDSPRFRLIFTTSVVGMGFDPPAVDCIIHAKPPRNLSNYFQEIGRAGRRGQVAEATLFYCNADISKNLPGIQSDIIGYCKTDSCLRQYMLANFGFLKTETSPTGCKCCTNCIPSCVCHDCILVKHVDSLNL